MIGQAKLLELMDTMIEDGNFPRFCVIQGADGSGKRLVVEHIKERINNSCIVVMDNSVDSVRNAMQQAYATTIPMVFYFSDADRMSQAARNALLKVTEEPPNNAYFILTVISVDNLTDTLKSRASIFTMLPYTQNELTQFMDSHYEYVDNEEFQRIALEVCDTPGEIELLFENDAQKLYAFVDKVMENIADVTPANALKITESIAFKDGDEGFDLALFWKAVILYYCKRMTSEAVHDMSVEQLRTIARIVMSTKECINMVTTTKGINKRNVFDVWILDIRGILGEEYGTE